MLLRKVNGQFRLLLFKNCLIKISLSFVKKETQASVSVRVSVFLSASASASESVVFRISPDSDVFVIVVIPIFFSCSFFSIPANGTESLKGLSAAHLILFRFGSKKPYLKLLYFNHRRLLSSPHSQVSDRWTLRMIFSH